MKQEIEKRIEELKISFINSNTDKKRYWLEKIEFLQKFYDAMWG